jgi:hypothetical protein
VLPVALLFLVSCVAVACGSEAGGDAPPEPDPDPSGPADGGPNGTKDGGSNSTPDAKVTKASCTMESAVTLSVEEQRLANRLPGQSTAFAADLLAGTGFDTFAPDFAKELCQDGVAGAGTFDEAKALVTAAGTRLWRAAVDRVQGKRTMGTLPPGDDRMLYWARLTMTKTLRAWAPSFALTEGQKSELEWEFERASRGQYDIKLPEGTGHVRIVLSGFDPFTLGEPGATDDVNIRIGNPSGASALALDGYEFPLGNGKTGHIETFMLPVNYAPFERGMQEDTLGPWLKPGPARADIAITMSQGGGFRFKLEEYNGRFHGTFPGNDDIITCKASGAQLLPSAEGCSIQVPQRWLGYDSLPWKKDQPPQFVESSLPVDKLIAAKTGTKVPRPPDTQASAGNAFDVVWGYDYDVFPNCAQPQVQSLYDPVSNTYPPPGNPAPPNAAACARSGSGGDYLSNESAYRATLLRDLLGLKIPVGHIHTPVMTRFQAGNDSAITDAKFEAYRASIVQQGRLLVEEVAKSL